MRLYGRQSRVRARRRRVLMTLAGIAAVIAIPFGHLLLERGAVTHGVRVAGVPLGGSSRAQAQREIADSVGDQLQRDVTVTVSGRSATLSPYDLGVRVDAAATAKQALAAGRVRGGLLFSFGYSHAVAPVLTYPEHFALPPELAAVTQAPVDARLVLKQTGAAIAVPAKPGVGFDPAAALRTITAAALAGSDHVSLSTVPTAASITTAAARRAKVRVAQLLSGPIALTRQGGAAGEWPVRRLAPLLSATAYKHVIGVKYDPIKVGAALRPPLADYLRTPRDARWKVVGTKGRVLSSLSGVDLDARTTASHLTVAGLRDGPARTAALAFRVTQPKLTTKAARALGATSVVAQATTSLGDSSPNRVFNVALLAKLLDGAVVEAGATFSFNGTVGKRTAERGFREGQAIENGVLVPSIGGGVCQAATTVFDTAFHGGYKIGHRVNHSFFISHYPLGMDATVADTGPDFTFVNDSKNAIVIKATANAQTMTVVFLSRPLDRHVEYQTSAQTGYVEPKKRYYASPDVPAGTVSQTTLGERGFDVSVSRTVTDAHGKVLDDDTFRSRYIPEDAIYLIGKGGKLPAGQTLSGLYPGYTGSTAGVDLSTWLGKPAKKKNPVNTGIPADGTTGPGGVTDGTGGTTTGTTGATGVTTDPGSTTTDGTIPPAGQ